MIWKAAKENISLLNLLDPYGIRSMSTRIPAKKSFCGDWKRFLVAFILTDPKIGEAAALGRPHAAAYEYEVSRQNKMALDLICCRMSLRMQSHGLHFSGKHEDFFPSKLSR